MGLNISTPARRRHNRDLAIRLATHGVPIFPSNGKVPLIPLWTKLDTSLIDDERSKAIEKFQAKHGHAPEHVGCTTDPKVVKRLWSAIPDAVPSISCGPAGLLVLDPDSKNDGPNKLTKWFEENGQPVGCPITRTQSGGLHVYYRNDPLDPLGSSAGAFRNLGTDVRGIGGQVVAPGAIREDGRRYTPDPDAPDLIDAFSTSAIPVAPDAVVKAIGSRVGTTIADEDEQREIARLAASDLPDFETLTDPILGGFDLDALTAKDASFEKLLSDPSPDRSANRWALVNCLRNEYAALSVTDYATLLEGLNKDGAFGELVESAPKQGEYDNRAIVREFLKATTRLSEGDVFGAVDDTPEDSPPKKTKFELKPFAAFAAEYEPLEYVLDGVIVRGSLYTLTARTGAGKTTLLTPTALAVATGRQDILGIDAEIGRAAYLTFENPDDFRMKLIAAAKAHGVTAADNLDVGDMRVKPEAIFKSILRSEKEYSLIIVDTLQAAFDGDDFNDNKAILDFVSRLRKLTTLPGKPAVVIAAHPIKNATKDSLVPYGGGSVLNEVDGNLTLWRNDSSDITTLHWQGKFRGAEFTPMDFQITAPPCEGLLDAKGRVVKPPVVRRASESMIEGSEARADREVDAILRALRAEPEAPTRKLMDMTGVSKGTLDRRLAALAHDKLAQKVNSKWSLTAKGLKYVDKTPVPDPDPDWASAEESDQS